MTRAAGKPSASCRNRDNPYNTTHQRAHAQLVLAFVLDGQTSTLDDKKVALALAKECPAEVTAIGGAMGKSLGPGGKWGDPSARFQDSRPRPPVFRKPGRIRASAGH